MKTLERIQLSATQAEDINAEFTTWRNGRLVSLDEGDYVSLFIDHEDAEISELVPTVDGSEGDGEAVIRKVVTAGVIRVPKPLTRDMAINAAEMAAYGLKNAMEVASFNASLARKHRNDPNDMEVIEHDHFIKHIKDELTLIGI